MLTLIPPPAALTTLLEVQDVSKHFGGIYAVRHVSLSVHAGEIMGLVGANGAGKSTLLRVIAGAIKQDSGRVSVLGNCLPAGDAAAAASAGI